MNWGICHISLFVIVATSFLGVILAPFVYFEVISKDTWDRYRTEGLSYRALPVSKPGIYEFNLQCIRIVSNNPVENMRRFFIGDCSNYNDISWIGIPKDYEVKLRLLNAKWL